MRHFKIKALFVFVLFCIFATAEQSLAISDIIDLAVVERDTITIETENFITKYVKFRLSDQSVNSKPPIIFIPGLIPTIKSSLAFIYQLVKYDYEVYFIIPIGWNDTRSKNKLTKFNMDYNKWLREFLVGFADKYGKPVLLAHSMACIGVAQISSQYQNLPIEAIAFVSPVGLLNRKLASPLLWLKDLHNSLKLASITFLKDFFLLSDDVKDFLRGLNKDQKRIVRFILNQAITNTKLADGFWVQEFNPNVPFIFVLNHQDPLGYHKEILKKFKSKVKWIDGGGHFVQKSFKKFSREIDIFIKNIEKTKITISQY